MPIDRATLLVHLAQAEQHVLECDRHVLRQREIVAHLDERNGGDALPSRKLLVTFEEMLSKHKADRQRILDELFESRPARASRGS